ncbi:MAG TPA: G1 family glutamic endopeptidase [Thermomicrobiales bacterium]|nr:G1 family glutamic endopeptidase [Thermomicrobiales bacterium]
MRSPRSRLFLFLRVVLLVLLVVLAGRVIAGRLAAAAPSLPTVTALVGKARDDRGAPSPAAATPAAASPAPATPTATPAVAADAAIKAVIQRANDEQQQAFARNDPTLMRDTATSAYYDELVQTNRDLADGGVTDIELVALEWGPITARGQTGAQATTFETWRTTFSDGTTQQDRERNVYTLVLAGGAWKVQADAHPDEDPGQPAQPAQPGQPTPSDPNGAGAPPFPDVPTGPGQSRNWAGYAATGGDFTAVSATWTVPTVADDGSTLAGDATWVGIGGVRSRDLIQAGTDATLQRGRVRYTAWIETLPQAEDPISLAVSPGDVVSVSIAQQSDGEWLIAFQNQTTGQQYQTTVAYTSTHSSAEWIEEAPSVGRRTLSLDSFGTVGFTHAAAVENGQTVTITQAGGQAITMIDRTGQPLAQPSPLGGDGASFTVRRTGE